MVAPTENNYKSLFFSLAPFVFCHVEQAKRSPFISRKRCLIFFLGIPSKQYHIKNDGTKFRRLKNLCLLIVCYEKGNNNLATVSSYIFSRVATIVLTATSVFFFTEPFEYKNAFCTPKYPIA